MSVSVDGLVNSGLVERAVSEEDRREIRLRLTREGAELSKRSNQNAYTYKAMASALEQMPEDDVRTLLRIHQQLLVHLERYQPETTS